MLHKQKLGEAPTSGIEIIMGISAFISICFLIKAITVGAQKCYFPDGTEVNDDTPCRPQSSDQTSVCCGESDVCLGNSLCLIQTGYGAIARGSCTDPTWQSDDCPQYCQDGKFRVFMFPKYRVCFLLRDSASLVARIRGNR